MRIKLDRAVQKQLSVPKLLCVLLITQHTVLATFQTFSDFVTD